MSEHAEYLIFLDFEGDIDDAVFLEYVLVGPGVVEVGVVGGDGEVDLGASAIGDDEVVVYE